MKWSLIACAIVISPLARAQTVADSVADFSGTQGYRNWQYGYYDAPLKPSGFKPLPLFDGATWSRGNSYWTSLNNVGGHPNGTTTSTGRQPIENWAVRRWSAPAAGRYRIDVHAWKRNVGGGNGIVARLVVGDSEVWNAPLAFNDSNGVRHSMDRCLESGETIDLIIDPRNSNDLYDGSNYTALITIAPPLPGRLHVRW